MGFMKNYSGNYMKAAQLDGPVVATIDHGEETTLNGEAKFVIYFREMDLKPLILNKTNAGNLERIAGSDDPGALPNLQVELYVEPVNFQGKMVDSVRLRAIPF